MDDEASKVFIPEESKSHASDYFNGVPLMGIKFENIEFEEENLFDGFRPIFEPPPPTSSFQSNDDKLSDEQIAMNKSNKQVGKSVKLKVEMDQSVDLLL